MPNISNATNATFARNQKSSLKNQIKQLVVKTIPIERKQVLVDPMEVAPFTGRTVGAGLVAASSVEAQIPSQVNTVKFTTQAAGAKTLSWYDVSNTLDLNASNPGLFDSGDEPVLVIKGYGISGLTAVTQTNRTVTLSLLDTAGTPITFSSGSGANIVTIPGFSQIATNENILTGTEDLDNKSFQLVFPLSGLLASVPKIFSNLTLTFAFPTAAQFIIYNVAMYRSMEDYEGNEPAPIYVAVPDSSDVQDTINQVFTKAGNGITRGVKTRATESTVTFDAPMAKDDMRRAMGYQRLAGGNRFTIPVEAAMSASISSLGELNKVASAKDVIITYVDEYGTSRSMGVVSGTYVDRGQVGFVKTSGGAKLYFNAADIAAGLRFKAIFKVADSGYSKFNVPVIPPAIRCSLAFLNTDTTAESAGSNDMYEYADAYITLSEKFGAIQDESDTVVTVNATPVTDDASGSIRSVSYKR